MWLNKVPFCSIHFEGSKALTRSPRFREKTPALLDRYSFSFNTDAHTHMSMCILNSLTHTHTRTRTPRAQTQRERLPLDLTGHWCVFSYAHRLKHAPLSQNTDRDVSLPVGQSIRALHLSKKDRALIWLVWYEFPLKWGAAICTLFSSVNICINWCKYLY